MKQATADTKTPASTIENSDEERAETEAKGAAQTLTAFQTTGEIGADEGDAGVAEGNVPAAESLPVYGRWPATLDARWAEVEFMLCHEVDCEESLQYTIEATEAGLVFMEKLEEKAQVWPPATKYLLQRIQDSWKLY